MSNTVDPQNYNELEKIESTDTSTLVDIESFKEAPGLNRKQRRAMVAMQRKGKNSIATSREQVAPEVEAIGEDGWNDLHRLYLECHALSVTPAQLLPLFNDKEKLETVKDPKALVVATKELSALVSEHRAGLEAIFSKHRDRKGSASSPDDLMVCLSIGEQYQEWLFSYQTKVQPTINKVLSMFAEEAALEGEFLPAN